MDPSLLAALDSKLRDALASRGLVGGARESDDDRLELVAERGTLDGPMTFGRSIPISALERVGPAGLAWSFAGQAARALAANELKPTNP